MRTAFVIFARTAPSSLLVRSVSQSSVTSSLPKSSTARSLVSFASVSFVSGSSEAKVAMA